jgi:hypothetical protein
MQFLLTQLIDKSAKPDPDAFERINRLIHEMLGAGVLITADSILPNSTARMAYGNGKHTMVDRSEDSSDFDAFVLIDVSSRDDAIKWSGRLAAAHAGANEASFDIRQLSELSKASAPVESSV